MCLLDGIVEWNPQSICCYSRQHRAADNPLRQAGRLGIMCGIEFAAQAIALHGSLAGTLTERPRAGYIASLREVACFGDCLDTLEEDLTIRATHLAGDGDRVAYAFAVSCRGRELVTGRATLLLRVELE